MIADKLKDYHRASDGVTREFIGLMRSTFAYYDELNTLLREKLPTSLHQSELAALVSTEIKPRLFNPAFCDRIQEALKSLRRAIIRLEDLRRDQPELPPYVNNLESLAGVAERVESLYQRHWEYYRYQNHVKEQELVEFLLDVDNIGYEWDVYLEGYSTARDLVSAVDGTPLGDEDEAVQITYQQQNPAHFAVGTLKTVMDFLESSYRFVCAVRGLDAESRPLAVLHVEIGEPIELRVSIPQTMAEPYRRFLQYLFLKDMLQREALLKFVMEAILKEYRPGTAGALPNQAAMQKELSARLKALPTDGHFSIADRKFPGDGIEVMHEFVASLDKQNIPHKALLQKSEKGARRAKTRKTAKVDEKAPSAPPTSGQVREAPPLPRSAGGGDAAQRREHIGILTGAGLEPGPVPKP